MKLKLFFFLALGLTASTFGKSYDLGSCRVSLVDLPEDWQLAENLPSSRLTVRSNKYEVTVVWFTQSVADEYVPTAELKSIFQPVVEEAGPITSTRDQEIVLGDKLAHEIIYEGTQKNSQSPYYFRIVSLSHNGCLITLNMANNNISDSLPHNFYNSVLHKLEFRPSTEKEEGNWCIGKSDGEKVKDAGAVKAAIKHIYHCKGQKFDGAWEQWNRTGSDKFTYPYIQAAYKDGLYEGKYKRGFKGFDSNIGSYKNGLKDGVFEQQEFKSKPVKKYHQEYKDGILSGKFHLQGSSDIEGSYSMGILNGPWQYKEIPSKKILTKLVFKNGVPDKSKFTPMDSPLASQLGALPCPKKNATEVFHSPTTLGEVYPLAKFACKDGLLHGPFTEYEHHKGLVAMEATFQDGYLNGPVTLYNSGMLMAKYLFEKGIAKSAEQITPTQGVQIYGINFQTATSRWFFLATGRNK